MILIFFMIFLLFFTYIYIIMKFTRKKFLKKEKAIQLYYIKKNNGELEKDLYIF